MVRIFYSNQSYALFLVPFLIGGYVAINAYLPTFALINNQLDLGLWGSYSIDLGLISQFLGPGLILTEAIMINMLYNRNEFFDRNNYLPALLFVTSTSFFPLFYALSGTSIAFFFFVFSFRQFFKFHQNEDGRKAAFNLGFLFAIAASFYPLLMGLFPLLFLVLWTFRPFVFRESALIITGIFVPVLYGVLWMFWQDISFETSILSRTMHTGFTPLIILTSGMFIFFVLSLKTTLLKMQQGSIRIRKIFRVLVFSLAALFVLSAGDYFLFGSTEAAAFMLIPLVFIFPYAFGYKKLRPEASIVFHIFLLVSVGKFFIPYFL